MKQMSIAWSFNTTNSSSCSRSSSRSSRRGAIPFLFQRCIQHLFVVWLCDIYIHLKWIPNHSKRRSREADGTGRRWVEGRGVGRGEREKSETEDTFIHPRSQSCLPILISCIAWQSNDHDWWYVVLLCMSDSKSDERLPSLLAGQGFSCSSSSHTSVSNFLMSSVATKPSITGIWVSIRMKE